jgi:hypothetical protein
MPFVTADFRTEALGGRQELLSVHVAGKNQLVNSEMCGHLSLSPFVRIQ